MAGCNVVSLCGLLHAAVTAGDTKDVFDLILKKSHGYDLSALVAATPGAVAWLTPVGKET